MVAVGRPFKAVTALILPASLLAACGDDGEEYTAYCVNDQNQVVDDNRCDDTRGGASGGMNGFWFVMLPSYGSPSYSSGQYIPRDRGYQRINSGDTRARSNAGLAPKGTVKSGTKIGGLGKGGVGKVSGGG